MSTRVAVFLAVAVIACSWLCPNGSSSGRVDPGKLISMVVAREFSADYVSEQRRLYRLASGETLECDVVVAQQNGRRGIWPIGPYPGSSAVCVDYDACWGEERQRRSGRISANYLIVLDGEDVVAGRECWALHLLPRTDGYPWKQFWVDKETWVVLASRDWSGSGVLKRSMSTTRIRYGRDLADQKRLLKTSFDEAITVRGQSVAQNDAGGGDGGWRRRISVPQRFELVDIACSESGADARLVYSDGLYSLTVIVDEGPSNGAGEGADRVTDCGQVRVLSVSRAGMRVMVVGDVPDGEMRKIAESVL